MSATASLMRPDVAAWSSYQPAAPRQKSANTKSTSATVTHEKSANPEGADGSSSGADEMNAFFAFLMSEQALHDVASDGNDESDGVLDDGMMMSLLFPAISGNSQNGEGGNSGTGAVGDSNVGTIGGGNPAGIAQSVLGQSAASIMSSQKLPMHQGVPTNVCCANFVSACLTKSGLLPASEHTDNVSTLKSTLQNRGWRPVSRSEAKPGDVCIIGGDEHVELVAKNVKGCVTLIGSNNKPEGQVVGLDGVSGNQGNVQYFTPP